MHPDISPYIYIFFTAATAIGVLIQAGVLLGLFIGFRRLQGKLELILTHVTEYALPLITSSKSMLEELSPKLKAISDNLVEISETLKHESQNVKVSVDDVLAKTRAQTARVDEMVSGTLDGISHAGAVIQQGVEVPLRHLHGVFNGVRAGFSAFRGKKTEEPIAAVVGAEQDFVVVVEEVASGRDIS